MEALGLFFQLAGLYLDIQGKNMSREQLEMSRKDAILRERQYLAALKAEQRDIKKLNLYEERVNMAKDELGRELVKENEFLFEHSDKQAASRMLRGFVLDHSFGHIVLRLHMTNYEGTKVTLPISYFVACHASREQKLAIVNAYIDAKLENTKDVEWFDETYMLTAASFFRNIN
jgi:hypothetical protein